MRKKNTCLGAENASMQRPTATSRLFSNGKQHETSVGFGHRGIQLVLEARLRNADGLEIRLPPNPEKEYASMASCF